MNRSCPRADLVSGICGIGVIALILAFVAKKWASRNARSKKRVAEMQGAAPEVIQTLDAMCHAAKADGRLDAREIALMTNIAKQVTGGTFGEAPIRRMYELAEDKPTDPQFRAFGKGLTLDQKRLVMQAVLMVVGSNGELDNREMTFVQNLANGLKISGDEVRAIFHSIAVRPA